MRGREELSFRHVESDLSVRRLSGCVRRQVIYESDQKDISGILGVHMIFKSKKLDDVSKCSENRRHS